MKVKVENQMIKICINAMFNYNSDKPDDDEKYFFCFCFSESGVRLDLQEKQDFPKFYCFLPQNRLLLFYTR